MSEHDSPLTLNLSSLWVGIQVMIITIIIIINNLLLYIYRYILLVVSIPIPPTTTNHHHIMTSQQTTLKCNVSFLPRCRRSLTPCWRSLKKLLKLLASLLADVFLWFGNTQVTSKAEKRHVRLGNTLVTEMMNNNHQLVGFIHVYDLFGR